MQYNSHATDQDCVSEILDICGGATTDDYSLNAITRRFNKDGLDRYFFLAFKSDGRWNFDDLNETSPPIDSQNIVLGTNRYKFSDFAEKILSVLKIELLDADGDIVKIKPDSMNELEERGDNFDEIYVNPDSGIPTKYIKYGDFIYFDKKPNWSKTAGLLAYFNRPASYMLTTDTTKEPGVPIIHHQYLCRKAALPFLIQKRLSQRGDIAQMIIEDEKGIKEHFSRSPKDQRQGFTVKKQNNR